VGVWSVPSRVTETLGEALVLSVSVPAFTVAVAVTFDADAETAAAREIAPISVRRAASLRDVFTVTARSRVRGAAYSRSSGRGNASSPCWGVLAAPNP
jgi:hypothetical protein